MRTHKPEYIVNIKFTEGKSQEEVTDAYTQFYVGVVSRLLKSSPMPLDKKNEMLDVIIKKYSLY